MIRDQNLLFWLGRVVIDVLAGELGENVGDEMLFAAELAASDDRWNLSEEQVLQLSVLIAKHVFNDQGLESLEDLSATIGGSFSSVTDELVQEILVFSVSSFECPCREVFVRNILAMDSEIQTHLMQTIQSILQSSAVEEETVEEPELESKQEALAMETQLQSQDTIEDSSELNIGEDLIVDAEVSKTVCAACVQMEFQLDSLRKTHATERQRLEEDIMKLKHSIASETARLVDTEVVLQEKDRVIRGMEKELESMSSLQGQVQELTSQIEDRNQRLMSLQDLIDMQKNKVEKVDQLEKTILKLKEKLTDLQEVRNQLKIETDNHSQTYQKLIEAEQEVARLQHVDGQVEEYRAELAERAIALSDAQSRLSIKETEITHLRDRIQQLEKGKEVILASQTHLAAELEATAEQLRSQEKCEGLGEGMSEFNPQIMQELGRLRAENADLYTKLDRTSLQSVERVQRELADQKAMVKSLQEKWTMTKQTLERTQRDLEQLQRRHEALSSAHDALLLSSAEHEQMAEEDVAALQIDKVYFQRLQRDTQSTLLRTQDQLEDTNRKRKFESEEYEEAIAKLRAEHEAKVSELHTEHSAALVAQEGAFQQTLAAEHNRYAVLQADLDQEVLKRRKIERLKKLYESESQRQKLQLQNLSTQDGASAGEFDVAAKEIRALQEKLDEAHQEIHSLKTQLAMRGSVSIDASASKENAPNKVQGLAGGARSALNKPLRMVPAASNVPATGHALVNYAEQAELHDKHIEQLAREKRELLSKSLEENKEKLELSQRVMALDKENNQLRAELRKRTLEKERLERSLLKQGRSVEMEA